MSDPVKNVEIEDVLSSIRRLVSENAKNAAPEALVLTPNDRVSEPKPDLAETNKAETPKKPRVTLAAPGMPNTSVRNTRKEPVLSRTLNSARVEDAVPSDAANLPPMPEVAETVKSSISEEAVIEAAETQALEETISHIEASVGSQDADWEPDDVFLDETGADDYRPKTAAANDVDLEALREIVVDMIRQELRGALGEKITRNVRKLVRREIQRAVTSTNFD